MPTKTVASTDTVSVACNHPLGVVLDLDQYVMDGPEGRGQVRVIKGRLPPVTLRGRGKMDGYAITSGVSAEFMEEWMRRNRDTSSLVRDNFIYVMDTEAQARDRAIEQAAIPQIFPPAKKNEVKGVTVASDDNGKPIIAHNAQAA